MCWEETKKKEKERKETLKFVRIYQPVVSRSFLWMTATSVSVRVIEDLYKSVVKNGVENECNNKPVPKNFLSQIAMFPQF